MDSKSINRLWMIKQLKFFRFLFHLFIFGSVLSFFLFGIIPLLVCMLFSVLFFSLSDMIRINLDYSST